MRIKTNPELDNPTLQEIAEQLHKIYEPNCTECSYTDNDWKAVKEVVLPIINCLKAEVENLKEKLRAARDSRLKDCLAFVAENKELQKKLDAVK